MTDEQRPVVDDRKRIVAAGYDTIARRYLAWGAAVEDDPRGELLEVSFLWVLARRSADPTPLP